MSVKLPEALLKCVLLQDDDDRLSLRKSKRGDRPLFRDMAVFSTSRDSEQGCIPKSGKGGTVGGW